jgi:osmotically-inducible protein OsmY
MKKTLVMIGVAALAFGLSACTESDRYAAEPNDDTITADVARMLENEGVSGNIDVSANDGVVTLSGTVPNEQAKKRAEDIADDIYGVETVQNQLRTTMAGDAPIHPGESDVQDWRDQNLRDDPAADDLQDDPAIE